MADSRQSMDSAGLLPVQTPRPQRLEFPRSIQRRELVKILTSFKVKTDESFANLLSAELERRIKIALSDSQRLGVILPLSTTTYRSLGVYGEKKGNETEQDDASSSLLGPFSRAVAIQDLGSSTVRASNEDIFQEVVQLLQSIVQRFDRNISTILLKDSSGGNTIVIRLVEVKACSGDPEIPIIFVRFYHDTQARLDTGKWMRTCPEDKTEAESSMLQQHVLLRILFYNSRRLPADCAPLFANALTNSHAKAEEAKFVPSFIVPIGPLTPACLADLARITQCSYKECTDPSPPIMSLCSACSLDTYCSPACQEQDYARHRPLCIKVKTSDFITIEGLLPERINYGTRISLNSTLQDISRRIRDLEEQKEEAILEKTIKEGLQNSIAKHPNGQLFLLKILVSSARDSIMIYDMNGIIEITVWKEMESEAYDKLYQLAKEFTRWDAQKVYLWARHEVGSGTLQILTTAIPDQDQYW